MMLKACYANQMRKMDSEAMQTAKIPGIILMENAAISCVNELKKDFPDLNKKRIAIFCGKGNNGGDGFVIARHLFNHGCEVAVFLVCGDSFTGDALINYEIIKRINIEITELCEENLETAFSRQFDIFIDAIFGTGIKGEIRGLSVSVINKLNQNGAYTLSVDIPSGINADTGEVCGVCVKADKTVTFAAYKLGLLMYPGADFAGKIVCTDISIPQYITESVGVNINIIDKEFFRENMPKRKNNSQKGNYGKVLIIAGSKGMTGAAYLSAQSAMLCGSGLVTLAIPDCINDILEVKTTESMTLPVKSNDGHFAPEAAEEILEKAEKCDAVLIGPGIGVNDDTIKLTGEILKNSKIPVIVDADAINCLSRNMSILEECKCDLILTPHSVEFSRLTGMSVEEIEADRVGTSREFAKRYGLTLILKGSRTIVTAADATQYINITGNPGLATGGSGDVLSGICASFTARGIKNSISAAMAVFLHGVCGDCAKEKYGMESVIATRIMQSIPDAYNQILQLEK